MFPIPQYAVGFAHATALAVGIVLLHRFCGWTSPCSVKRKRPFPHGGEAETCPYGQWMWCRECRSPAHGIGIRLQNYCGFAVCGIGANRHLQPVHRHLQPTDLKPFQPRLNMCSFAHGNSSTTIKMCIYEHK